MQILIAVGVNILILAVVLPLFYILITSRTRERLEDEAIKKVRDELSGLVREFNNTAITNVTLLEDNIKYAQSVLRELRDIENRNIVSKNISSTDFYTKENNSSKLAMQMPTAKKVKTSKIIKDDGVKKSNQKFSYVEENRVRLIADEDLQDSVKDIYKKEAIINLYKNGLSVQDIAVETECSITEINLVLDMFSK